MSELADYAEWMSTGRLSPYVIERKSAGAGIKLFECMQPAGDMSDPATSSMVLVQLLSTRVEQRSDFGSGKRHSTAAAGALFLAPPAFASDIDVFVPHRIRVFGFDSGHFRAVMEEARPGRAMFDFGRLHLGPFHVPQLGRLLGRMWDEAADSGNGRLFAEGAALQVLAMLSEEADRSQLLIRGGLAPWAERRVREYLDEHLARDIALAELAELVGLSKFHFTRMFKQSMGVPPYVYLRRLRVERAKRLLVRTDWAVTEVGAAVGYDTPQAFARMFRAEAGMSPTQWRRAHGMA